MSVPHALKRCDAFNDDERRRGLLFTMYTLFYEEDYFTINVYISGV